MFAATAMSLSSVSVVLNASRLKGFKLSSIKEAVKTDHTPKEITTI